MNRAVNRTVNRAARRVIGGRASQRGFSLIEVLVALTVLAVALGGALQAVTRSAQMRTQLQDRTFAFWMAAEVVDRMRLQAQWPAPGENKAQYEDASGRTWYGRTEVEETPDEGVRRVRFGLADQEGAEALVRLVVYLRQPIS